MMEPRTYGVTGEILQILMSPSSRSKRCGHPCGTNSTSPAVHSRSTSSLRNTPNPEITTYTISRKPSFKRPFSAQVKPRTSSAIVSLGPVMPITLRACSQSIGSAAAVRLTGFDGRSALFVICCSLLEELIRLTPSAACPHRCPAPAWRGPGAGSWPHTVRLCAGQPDLAPSSSFHRSR